MSADRVARWREAIADRCRTDGIALSSDVIEELVAHVADTYAASRRAGSAAEDALAEADRIIAAGDYFGVGSRTRARRANSRLTTTSPPVGGAAWSSLASDLRSALRAVIGRPLVSLSVVAILSTGIGVTAAAYAVIRPVLLSPLAYPRADDLVVPTHESPTSAGTAFSPADWRDYASANQSLAGLAAYASWPLNLVGVSEPLRLRSVIVSGDFFAVMGLPAAYGRVATAADDRPDAPAVAVLSDGSWRRIFGADRSVVGSVIHLNGQAVTVIGIMPPAFAWPDERVDLWMPMALSAQTLGDRRGEWLSLVGRIRTSTSVATAESDLSALASTLALDYPGPGRPTRIRLASLATDVVGQVRRPLELGALAALGLLCAAIANAANLVLASVSLRREEMAVRAALGASPGRITRGLLLENVLLALTASLLGSGLAALFVRVFAGLADGRVPRIGHLIIDLGTLGVAIATAGVSATVVGLTAARRVVKTARTNPLLGSARVLSGPTLAQSAFLAAQVAAALVLTSGAALVAQAYVATSRIEPGFNTSDLMTMQITLPRSKYRDGAAHARFIGSVLGALQGIPGVANVGAVSDLPFVGNALHFQVTAEGSPAPQLTTVRLADAGFFTTLRIPLLAGRSFGAGDRFDTVPVAVLNETAANRYGGRPVIGRRLAVEGEGVRTVIGIVGDIKHAGLRADEGAVLYAAFSQPGFDFVNWMGLVARVPEPMPPAVAWHAAVSRVDPNQPVDALESMDAYLAQETAPYRFGTLIVGSLATTTLLLVLAGVAALTAFLVGRRSRELALRLALGATPRAIVRLTLAPLLVVLPAGAVVGLAGTVVTTAMLTHTLDAASEFSGPWIAAASVLLVAVTAVGAAWVPALRGARLDASAALRGD